MDTASSSGKAGSSSNPARGASLFRSSNGTRLSAENIFAFYAHTNAHTPDTANFRNEGESPMIKVLTYGTYDLLHIGHINLLSRARSLGDHLTVGLSTDEFNEIKHKTSFLDFESRKAILESIRYVDLVIPEHDWEQKINDIRENNIDIFVMKPDSMIPTLP